MDDAIVRATAELLAEVGLNGTTIGAVAKRAGVARATIYLRWPGRDALIAAAVRRAIGRPPFSVSGDIVRDLQGGGRYSREVLMTPGFVSIFPELARALLAPAPEASYDEIVPSRQTFTDLYRQAAGAAGLRNDIDPALPFDLLAGVQLNHLLATGTTLSPEATDQAVEVILAGLRRPEPESAGGASTEAPPRSA